METDLKKCPFCGSEAYLSCSKDGKTFYAGCRNSDCCDNRYFGSAEEAVLKWNTRKKHYKLKPCPFCGGKAETGKLNDINDYPYFVECVKCDAAFRSFESEKEAVKMWNTRHTE